jgi:hypothetical protein
LLRLEGHASTCLAVIFGCFWLKLFGQNNNAPQQQHKLLLYAGSTDVTGRLAATHVLLILKVLNAWGGGVHGCMTGLQRQRRNKHGEHKWFGKDCCTAVWVKQAHGTLEEVACVEVFG